ncbi:MAG TPA: DUF5666 domain-containing protein [Blastocatellia bacterium]|nr:DUF5666 domain-containing protein [Blastocatellia bacterium]
MKSNLFLRVAALIALMIGFCSGNIAFASGESETRFTGIIESLPSTAGFIGDWRVEGRTIHVTRSTIIEQEDGRVAVGASVKVEGRTRSDNSIDATEVEVKTGSGSDDGSGGGSGSDDSSGQPHFKGTIQNLPGTGGFIGEWRVGGRTIHVSSATRIETEYGPVAVGAFVEVMGAVQADGSMDASKIEVKSSLSGDDGRDELKGAIESLPQGFVGEWRVNGRTVHVTLATILNQEHGAFVIGAPVEVKGTMRSDGSMDATRIEVQNASSGSGGEGQSANLKGSIQSLPTGSSLIGDWRISNQTVHATSSTRLKTEHGPFAIGTRVKVKGFRLADGSIVATKIQVRDSK